MEHKVVKKTEVKVEEAKSKKDRELQEPKMSSEAELRNIVKPLVNWYRENKRDLPWRHNPDAYRVWISEIMLQQTRVEAVKGYYDRFLKALPTVKDLAEAEEDKLLKLWEGLGYYNRVRLNLSRKEVLLRNRPKREEHHENNTDKIEAKEENN